MKVIYLEWTDSSPWKGVIWCQRSSMRADGFEEFNSRYWGHTSILLQPTFLWIQPSISPKLWSGESMWKTQRSSTAIRLSKSSVTSSGHKKKTIMNIHVSKWISRRRHLWFYLFWVLGFSAVGFGNHCGCLKQLDHNAGQRVLGCSQGQQHLVSGHNGAGHGTWHSQSLTEVSARSQQSQPVCMCWDHWVCWRCAACFFWLRALGTWMQKRRRKRMMKGRVQGARTLGSGFGWLQALSSGLSLSRWISSHCPMVWNKNNTSSNNQISHGQ